MFTSSPSCTVFTPFSSWLVMTKMNFCSFCAVFVWSISGLNLYSLFQKRSNPKHELRYRMELILLSFAPLLLDPKQSVMSYVCSSGMNECFAFDTIRGVE